MTYQLFLMIAKITNGESFKGVLQYVLNEDKECQVLSSRGVLETDDINLLASQFLIQSKLSKRVKKPVWHAQLAFAKEDDSLINDELINQIGKEYLNKMGIKDNQYLIVKHNDTAHTHIHIVVNRVTSGGKVLRDRMMMKRSMEASKQLETHYGLTVAALKGKTIMKHSEISPYVYSFKPNKQILNQNIKRVIKDAKSRNFASFEALNEFLMQSGIQIRIASSSIENNQNTKIVDYTYQFFDNREEKVKRITSSINLSSLGKEFTYDCIISHLELNKKLYRYRVEELAKSIEVLLKKPRNSQIRDDYLFCYLYLNGLDVNQSYFVDAVKETRLKKDIKKQLLELALEENSYFLTQAELKQSIFKNEFDTIKFDHRMTYSFSKIDSDLLGTSCLKQFYELYLEHLNVELPQSIKNILLNKKADNNTVNYVISQLKGKLLPYQKSAVNIEVATVCFSLANQKKLKNNFLHEEILSARTVLKAYKNYKRFSEEQDELIIYLAKRGIETRLQNGNFHLYDNGKDLGLATTYNIKELGKYAPKRKILYTNDTLNEIFKKYYSVSSFKLYQLLDSRKIKEIGVSLKQGNSFILDKFDMKFMDQDDAKSLKRHFETQSHRGGLKMNFHR
ncbi:relaxase/mobilization nuclease domain-containing protein [Chondrinema litorale]|uniref:relaxase/mobilization nuclease domain-containing protein n=1 Tax=Chondrinema litorale TaxID=2994555 RepID=UPI002542AB08|nr:relaxase/mobilization nuclease domain-containing protein [Chondrinema litorale]UZR99010.1 relaxase/mobilization nuclease domain-containing protein [Chondrinema litorale]